MLFFVLAEGCLTCLLLTQPIEYQIEGENKSLPQWVLVLSSTLSVILLSQLVLHVWYILCIWTMIGTHFLAWSNATLSLDNVKNKNTHPIVCLSSDGREEAQYLTFTFFFFTLVLDQHKSTRKYHWKKWNFSSNNALLIMKFPIPGLFLYWRMKQKSSKQFQKRQRVRLESIPDHQVIASYLTANSAMGGIDEVIIATK